MIFSSRVPIVLMMRARMRIQTKRLRERLYMGAGETTIWDFSNPDRWFPRKPSWLAGVFVVEAAESGGHYAAAAEVADHVAGVGAFDYGEAYNVVAQHFRGGFGNQFVGIGD